MLLTDLIEQLEDLREQTSGHAVCEIFITHSVERYMLASVEEDEDPDRPMGILFLTGLHPLP